MRRGDISAAKSIASALAAQAGVQAALLARRWAHGRLRSSMIQGIAWRFHDRRSALPDRASRESCDHKAHVKAYPCINTGQSAVAAALKLHPMLKGRWIKIAQINRHGRLSRDQSATRKTPAASIRNRAKRPITASRSSLP